MVQLGGLGGALCESWKLPDVVNGMRHRALAQIFDKRQAVGHAKAAYIPTHVQRFTGSLSSRRAIRPSSSGLQPAEGKGHAVVVHLAVQFAMCCRHINREFRSTDSMPQERGANGQDPALLYAANTSAPGGSCGCASRMSAFSCWVVEAAKGGRPLAHSKRMQPTAHRSEAAGRRHNELLDS